MAGDRTPNCNQKIPYSELQNPLFIHPSDGPNSISVPEKLIGAKNYRSWRTTMEIHLSTKRKLVLVQGTLARATDDPVKEDRWDSCNNLVISWVMNSVKYRLNKDVYSIRQNRGSVSDYYMRIKGIWAELDSMMDLSKVLVANKEIANFLHAFGRMQEEQKLFQFLNGLDDVYKVQRSQILITHPLPSVETVCSILQQEELQREVLEEE
ncbi:hypothetical protein Cgig2_001605 [Carnegiea gigantea]|uniref:Retrotransposon Copia-like N-terminal domain-containing protein n=1 Tax=Carnegiea gigantea TaxID=171969 RepID=A0A9Q1KB74_9CARY|nr:hypothetical protein Cgig2_001605 [Carnegiea gigantea]